MLPIEPLFCPCCTPALLHTLAHTNLTRVPQHMLWLGTGAMTAAIKRHRQLSRSPNTNLIYSCDTSDPPASGIPLNKGE